MNWLKAGICAGAALLGACAHEPRSSAGPSACRTPMPLQLRARRIDERIAAAYAHAPPLSRAENQEIRRLAACAGAALMGGGDGCSAEWQTARASGLAERNRIGAGRFAIPDFVAAAARRPLGAERSNDLLVALATAHAAQAALNGVLDEAHGDDVLAMMLIGSDIEQAIICDAADLAAGRRAGMAYDPAAPIPPGP